MYKHAIGKKEAFSKIIVNVDTYLLFSLSSMHLIGLI